MKDNVINLHKENIFEEKMLRAKDLSKIFVNTTQSTFDNWSRAGLLHRHKICGGVYYKLSEVQSLINNSLQINEVG